MTLICDSRQLRERAYIGKDNVIRVRRHALETQYSQFTDTDHFKAYIVAQVTFPEGLIRDWHSVEEVSHTS